MAAQFSSLREGRAGEARVRLPLLAANQIQQAIIEGRYSPGDRLPIEKDLAEQLGVSRIVVREALKRLETLGLIKVRPGRDGGAFVQRPSTESINDALFSFLRMDGRDVSHVHELRRLLEPEIAALASERSTPLMLAELERALRREEVAVRDKHSFLSGMAFHGLLAQMTENPLLIVIGGLLTDITTSAHIWASFAVDQSLEEQLELVPDHQSILEAIRRRDPVRAKRLMVQHMERVIALETLER